MEKFYFTPKLGVPVFEDPASYKRFMKSLPDKRHVMEIKKYSAKRSNGANAYYWEVVIKHFMDEMGIPKSKSGSEYMHYDVLGQELRQVPDENRPGKTRTQPTHTMTGSEFWTYINQCARLFAHLFNGGSFPDPVRNGYDITKK
jgi:hypothetical protein